MPGPYWIFFLWLQRIDVKSYLFTDTLVYTIAHWSEPPRTYEDFSQGQQGRLVYVRTAVAATCIRI